MTTSSTDEPPRTIPLFPLQTVLFPDGLLPLRIFEPRYLDMVSESLRSGAPFGIVPIAAGSEVGQPPDIYGLGTTARIVSWDQGEDGLLQIVAEGIDVFRVIGHAIAQNQLLMGEVEYAEPVADAALPEPYAYLGQLLEEIFENNRAQILHENWRLDSARWVSYRLAEVLPIGVVDRLTVLESTEIEGALAHLDACLAEIRKQRRDGAE